MITIKLYKNGYEIIGHTHPLICGEVSLLAWNLANTFCRVDPNHIYYSSAVDNSDNPDEGYTYLIFNTENDKAVWLYDEYKHNLKLWAEHEWGKYVKITAIDDILIKDIW